MPSSLLAALGRMKPEGFRRSDVMQSLNPDLPPSIVAHILCFNVHTLGDVAKLRLVNKAVGQLAITMLPAMGNRVSLMSSAVEDYVKKMVHLDGYSNTGIVVGERWRLDAESALSTGLADPGPKSSHSSSDNLSNAFEDATVTQILFLGKPEPLRPLLNPKSERPPFTYSKRTRRRQFASDGHYEQDKLQRKLNLIRELNSVRNVELLEALFEQVRVEDSMDPVYQTWARKVSSAATPSPLSPQPMEENFTSPPTEINSAFADLSHTYLYPVLLTMELLGNARCIDRFGDSWLDLRISSVEPRTPLDVLSAEEDVCPFTVCRQHSNLFHQGVIISRRPAGSKNVSEIVYEVALVINLTGNGKNVGRYRSSKVEGIDDMALSSTTNLYQNLPAKEGVAVVDGPVATIVRWGLNSSLEKLARQIQEEHGLLELLDPDLFCYVAGITALSEQVPHEETNSRTSLLQESIVASAAYRLKAAAAFSQRRATVNQQCDFWGRRYDDTTYRNIPTIFCVCLNGTCTIEDYVNNLVPMDEFTDIYGDLEVLFAQFLPYIEAVFSHAVALLPEIRTADQLGEAPNIPRSERRFSPPPLQYISLRNRQLQVITRICEYVIEPGGYYDSLWKVKGMSHEEIVLTCMYVLDRDEGLKGGDVFLKRAFLQREANYIVSNVSNPTPMIVEWMVAEGTKPIGKVETRKGRLIVFPNSHISRLGRLSNPCSSTARMRILFFYVVNPLKRVISTREVPPQQPTCNGTMSLDDAQAHKRNLMEIRRCYKEDWNVYPIPLPETDNERLEAG